jgi:RimJ/RimL family protein N-acetyltransferase
MHDLREGHLSGLGSLAAVTALLQRVRAAHPTKGLYEAADLQWWWRDPRSTDDLPQLFWFDDDDRPEAAVIATDWGDGFALDPMLLPGASPGWVDHVIERGFDHARECGLDPIDMEVDRDDEVLREVLTSRGFTAQRDGLVETWMDATDVPEVSGLADGYRLTDRLSTLDRPHHMINANRNHRDVEQRLKQTSLYRPDLDLLVVDGDGVVASYGLFWFDPVTATGLVEPMRTEDDHQRRGLARHVLTAGLRRLADVGAQRIKICYHASNPAAEQLYLDVGFEPVKRTDIFARNTGDGSQRNG